MIAVAPYPFLRITVFFIAGIVSYVFTGPSPLQLEWILVFASFAFLLLFFIPTTKKKISLGILSLCICFGFGFWLAHTHKEINHSSHFGHYSSECEAYIGVVREEVLRKGKFLSTTLEVKAIRRDNAWKDVSGKVLVYFPIEHKEWKYGDWILVKGRMRELEPTPYLPFDYKKFLGFKNIYHQHFVGTGQSVWLKNDPPSRLWAFAYHARSILSGFLKKELGEGQEYAVASMLILGIKQPIEPQLLEAYSSSGAMHVLAVSGLHVGVVFGFIYFLFGKMSRSKIGSPVFYILALVCIWGFGFVTAFSPSVLRAVVMFTVVLVGKWIGRTGNLYNSVGITAFFILLFSPYMVTNIGFQMSFAAVLGIAFFNPKFKGLLKQQASWINMIWSLTCVSISAQVFTFPLAVYYFNQFPTYFWLTNLWIVPLSSCILYLGIAYFICLWSAFLSMWLGWLLKHLLLLFNKSMFLPSFLPYYTLRFLPFSALEVCLMVAITMMIALLIQTRDKKAVWATYGLVVLFACSRIHTFVGVHNRHQLILGEYKKRPIVTLVKGRSACVWMNDTGSVLASHKPFLEKELEGKGIVDVSFAPLPLSSSIMRSDGISLLVKLDKAPLEIDSPVDILWIVNGGMKIEETMHGHEIKHVILSDDNLINDKRLKTNCHFTKKGPFILDI